ncbi:DUF4089 domain-containing protein [Crocosphaera chwakensis]|uniref:DUF4089 domain-containing protein n=1 Tax=Crocosphaera chwakensis CCY0110 TaxID=391612 RepID=A3INB2_9CHRO|nr:DUF4089 domain-containing protein [Crocosphaera chwakensis]EAZ92089.1 hypothetical protein CY0110_00485 [Crocosphaera chwakensis CCY0110]
MNNKDINIREYIEQTSVIIDLPIDAEYMPGVIDNLTRIAEIAILVTEFELPETVEAAPIFQP